ncbi:MAG: putative glycosyltransferase, partial [Bacteroidota bacterium]
IKVDEVNLKKSTKINLLFIGRLIEEKNLFNTLTLLAKVNDIVPIKFDIYGDGPQENALQNFVKKNKIDFVEFKSKIKWEDISKIYPNYSHLILLSSSETWGMVANEAQFFNLNVICSSNCGCANDLIINNYNGLVINQMDNQLTPNSIANYLLKQKESSIFTKNNNLIFDESYTIRKFIKKLYLVNELK